MAIDSPLQAGVVADAQVAEALAAVKSWTSRSTSMIAVGLAALFVGFVALIIIINSQRAAAEDKAIRFERKANDAASTLEQARQAYAARDFNRVGVLLKAAIVQTETLAASAMTQSGQAAPNAVAPAGQVLGAGTKAPPVTVEPVAVAKPQTVYIQFAGRITRERIASLNGALRGARWSVAGRDGERTANATGYNEVRYHGEEDRAAAEALAASVSGAEVGRGPVTTRQMKLIRPGVLEVWVSN